MKPTTKLKKLGACIDAVEWVRQFKTLEEAWQKCERSDWMFWYYRKCNTDQKILVQIVVEIAERVLPIFESKYLFVKGPRRAIEAAKNWINNPTSAAAYAADADAAAYAADAAAYADAYAAYAAAYADELKIQTNIIRKYIPELPKFKK